MHHLVIAVFEDLVALHVLDVEMGVKPEPLFVLPLVGDLIFGKILVKRIELFVDVFQEVVDPLLPHVVIVGA